MEIQDWAATAELNTVMRDARTLGLERNLLELEAFGFTVIEPHQLKADDLCKRMLAATLKVSADEDQLGVATRGPQAVDESSGHEVGPRSPAPPPDTAATNRMLFHLHARHPVFLEAFTHPVPLTIARYLLGASCLISACAAFVKRGPVHSTFLHIDTRGVPPPLSPISTGVNISWILTDYSKEAGTFAFVPGSHKYYRHPTPGETPMAMGGTAPDICIPCEAKAGSLIVFGNNTWHGTYPKLDSDLRVHVVTAFTRQYVNTTERTDDIPEEYTAPYGSEMRRMLGYERWTGYGSEGANSDRLNAVSRVNLTPSA